MPGFVTCRIQRPDDVHGLAELELADHDLLRHLVGDNGREGDRE